MNIFLILIIVILILLCFLLLFPIHYDFKLKKDGEMEIKADANYPFGIIVFHLDYFLLLNFDLKIFGIKLLDRTIDLHQKKAENKSKNKKQKYDSIVSRVITLSIKDKLTLISYLKKDIARILKIIHPKYSNITIELGFKNPFLLGALLGLLSTIKLILKNLRIYPNFNERVFKIDMEAKSDISLITIMIIALKYRFSKKYSNLFNVEKRQY